MFSLSGFDITKPIYSSDRTLVFRGRRARDPVIIKTPRNPLPTPEESAALNTEYRIGHAVEHPAVVRFLALEWDGHRPALIVEDFQGRALSEALDGPVPVPRFFDLALQLAEGLEALHRQRITHKDINPGNIIYNPKTGVIKLADLGLATVLDQEGAAGQMNDGTLPYVSPEQSGRINRLLDYRTDFYSLGVTFYQMLTGELPFDTDDPAELLHAHIARVPAQPSAINPDVPSAVSRVVMKLLAKAPEDRYQTAAGLVADLRRCRELLQAGDGDGDGEFRPGVDDISRSFRLPEKLYGRGREQDTLHEALERAAEGSRLMVQVSGLSGTGKTALCNELQRTVAHRRDWMVAGKFDQLQGDVTRSAFFAAVGALARLILTESDERLERWQTRLAETVGAEGQVLVEAVPELGRILGPCRPVEMSPRPGTTSLGSGSLSTEVGAGPKGPQPDVPPLPPRESEHRFHRLIGAVIKAAADELRPLTIFLDDLQRADASSLRLLEQLLSDEGIHHLLVVAAFRSDEVDEGPLRLALAEIQSGPAELYRVELGALQTGDVAGLIGDTLRCGAAQAEALAEQIMRKTLGNPLFVQELLRSLHDAGLLSFDAKLGRWTWDQDSIEEHHVAEGPAELLLERMGGLPPATRRVLELAACIGVRFDLATLDTIYGGSAVELVAALRPAVDSGVLHTVCSGFGFLVKLFEDAAGRRDMLPKVRCEFQHDRLHQAAYASLPEQRRGEIHLELARLLARDAREGRLFEVVNHFNAATQQLNDGAERLRVARLNLEAGESAQGSAGREVAGRYFRAGVELLPDDAWETDQALSFELRWNLAGTMLLKVEHAEETLALGEMLIVRAANAAQRLNALALHVIQLSTRGGDPQRALELGVEALADVGIEIDLDDPAPAVEAGYQQLKGQLTEERVNNLLDLPRLVDEEKSAAMLLLEHLFFFPVYMVRRDLGPLVALQAMRISLEHGNGPGSEAAYVVWGMIVAHNYGNFRAGHRLGRLAVALADKLGVHRAMTRMMAGVTDWPVMSPHTMHEQARAVFRMGVEDGDHTAAAICAGQIAQRGLTCGDHLRGIYEECRPQGDFVARHMGTAIGTREIHLTLRTVENLLGEGERTELFDSAEQAEQALSVMGQRNPEARQWYYLLRARLCYLFGEDARALSMADEAERFADRSIGHYGSYEIVFYRALAAAAVAADRERFDQCLATVHQSQALLSTWVDAGAHEHFGFMAQLVSAEEARLTGDAHAAGRAYEEAIATAAAAGMIQNQALANELAARFYAGQGLDKVAQVFVRDAHYCYQRWGAKAKLAQLERQHPALAPERVTAGRDLLSHTTGTQVAAIDIATVFKASQTISSEMMLDALLRKLLSIIVENAGAQRGFLVLQREGGFFVEAAAGDGEVARLESAPLSPEKDATLGARRWIASERLPAGILQYVARTGELVVLADASVEGMFRADPYVSRQRPRSILCLPLANQGQLVGLVYLENNLTGGAFDGSRLEVTRLLCAQAAISIHNARLYSELEHSNRQLQEYSQTLEQRVAARTTDLADKNEQLNQSLQREREMQNQLLLSEKMASLGNLVAGVAHELNTPIGAIASSVDTSRRCVDKLRGGGDRRTFDLLEGGLRVMTDASERINSIVTTLRSFARLDEAERKPADLHEGIESTLTLLGHKLHDGVEVARDLGELPMVLCYPNQLNQVFMNLLQNAIDAVGQAGDEVSKRITIRTWGSQGAGQVHVQVQDTGPGIPPDLHSRIFEPGFTTKGVGVGTGLGLAICYQIVQKHGGTIDVASAPGEGTAFTVSLPS